MQFLVVLHDFLVPQRCGLSVKNVKARRQWIGVPVWRTMCIPLHVPHPVWVNYLVLWLLTQDWFLYCHKSIAVYNHCNQMYLSNFHRFCKTRQKTPNIVSAKSSMISCGFMNCGLHEKNTCMIHSKWKNKWLGFVNFFPKHQFNAFVFCECKCVWRALNKIPKHFINCRRCMQN